MRKHMRKINIAFSMAAAIIAVLATTSVVYAHLWSGNKWGSSQTSYHLNTPWNSSITAAGTTWNNAPGSFALAPTGNTAVPGYVTTKDFRTDPNLPDNWTGATALSGAPTITRATTYLNSALTWYTNGNWPDVQTVALHEFGHWVEFNDSCTVTASVMCATGTVKRSLNSHDTTEVQAVYP
jgi:hypothetical protein